MSYELEFETYHGCLFICFFQYGIQYQENLSLKNRNRAYISINISAKADSFIRDWVI